MANIVHVPYPGETSITGLCGQKIYNPDVPFNHGLGKVYPGKMIFISGIPDSDSSRFYFNLESAKAESATIAFHFDVRFEYGDDRNVIVRNAKLNGEYGKEERSLSKPFPFNRNEFFEIIILVEQSCFKVAVNNQHLLEFEHRFPIEDVDTLAIRGDVRISMVRIQG